MNTKKESIFYVDKIKKTFLNDYVAFHKNSFKEENNLSILVGDEFLKKTYMFFLKDPLSFGYVAIKNGNIIGMISGRLDYYSEDLNKYWPRRISFLKWIVLNPLSIIRFNKLRSRLFLISKNIILKFFLSNKNNMTAPSHIDNGTATLASLSVLNNSKSSIVAESLVSKAEEFCKINKKKIIRTGVSNDNIKARFFYRKRGYVIDEVLGENLGSIFMYKEL